MGRLHVDKARGPRNKGQTILITQNYAIGQFARQAYLMPDNYTAYMESQQAAQPAEEEVEEGTFLMSAKQQHIDGGGDRGRELVCRQLIANPNRDNRTIMLVCAEDDVDISKHYIGVIKARWRNSLKVLRDAGYDVPLPS